MSLSSQLPLGQFVRASSWEPYLDEFGSNRICLVSTRLIDQLEESRQVSRTSMYNACLSTEGVCSQSPANHGLEGQQAACAWSSSLARPLDKEAKGQ